MTNRRSDPPAARAAEIAAPGDVRSPSQATRPDLAICQPVWFPVVQCARHGNQKSGYWICEHIGDGSQGVGFRLTATSGLSGMLLCSCCSDLEYRTARRYSGQPAVGLRLACPRCLHTAGLIESPEVLL